MPKLQFKIDPKLRNIFTESENVILFTALNGNGVFRDTYDVLLDSENGIILSDSNFIYPLGKVSAPKNMPNDFKGVLGRTVNVKKILKGKNWLVMDKIFAKLNLAKHDLFNKDDLPGEDIKIYLAGNESQLKDFCNLKRAFILEESQEALDPKKIYSSLKESYLHLRPALLFFKGQAVGMISSNFYSSKGAMINLLFIEKKFRRRGLGTVLLKWYIKSLSKISNNIYLFYSSDNLAAKKLYGELGFQEIDNWIMALKNS